MRNTRRFPLNTTSRLTDPPELFPGSTVTKADRHLAKHMSASALINMHDFFAGYGIAVLRCER